MIRGEEVDHAPWSCPTHLVSDASSRAEDPGSRPHDLDPVVDVVGDAHMGKVSVSSSIDLVPLVEVNIKIKESDCRMRPARPGSSTSAPLRVPQQM